MAMFGKQQFTATAAYDEKKSDSSNKKKDKGILNMPISTNIQISKKGKDMKAQEQAQNSFDPFDPFDPFPIRVGERVQVDEEGHIVAFGAEEEKKEEVKAEATPDNNGPAMNNPWDNLDNVPVVGIDEANRSSHEQNVPQPQNTVIKAEKPEITSDMLSQLASEIAPKMSKSLVDDITKEVTSKLGAQISQSIPTGSGDVKVVEPKITADALSEVVKQVTDSVNKTVNAQISAEIAKQLSGVSLGFSGIEKNVQGIASSVSSDFSERLNAMNSDFSNKLSTTNDRIIAMSESIAKKDNSAEFNRMNAVIASMNEQIVSMKDILEKPLNLSDEERDAKLKEAIEEEKNKMYRGIVIPVLVSVVEARENMLRMAQVYKEKGTDVPSGVMKGYGLDLGDALEKNRVEIYQSKKGDKFDPKIHKKIGTASATKEDQDGQVATSLSCGYKYNGEVIFPEKVDVYLFKK